MSVNTGNRPAVRLWTLANTGLGLAFAVTLAVFARQIAREDREWLFGFCVSLVVCAAALVRERHRVGAAVVGIVVAGGAGVVAKVADLPREPGAASALALLVLGGSAVRALPLRAAAAVAVGGVAAMAVDWLSIDPESGVWQGPFQLGAVGWAVALGVGAWLRWLDYRRHAATEAVRREERLALARELHDIVAHHVTGIVLQTQAAKIVSRSRPEALDETLTGIEQAGTDALTAMRRVVGLLRDTDDGAGTTPGPEGLTELVRRFEGHGHGPAVRLNLPEEKAAWSPEVTTTVYRIVQEALTNIARHAPHARTATVDVLHAPDGITVEITDDAPPAPARYPHRGGFGLIGMRERVETLGGTLRAGPGSEAGWSIHATLPVAAGERP
ncbi:sensor histidine kinase [Streptomyces cinnamoneus]|uniref:sensor histidine kinase n=1 Tax=Streptomyces cinnamoneus TaxID=53446 RepID=UPI0019614117|nr:histidine kinase [Streptomyces cinnamoneus]